MSDWDDYEIGRNTDKIFLKIRLPPKFLLAHFQSKYATLPQDTRTIWSTVYNYWFNLYFIYNGILLGYKKNETVPFAVTWIDLEMTILNEVNQQRMTNITWEHSCMES